MNKVLEKFNNKNLNRDEMLIWWLGGASFYLKTSNYKIIIDPYLTNSAFNVLRPFFDNPEKELSRLESSPLEPNQIDCDYFICTHDHLDHLDPDTIKGIRNKKDIKFIGPTSCTKHFKRLGIHNNNILEISRGQSLKLDEKFYLRAINAKHRGPLDIKESIRLKREVYGEDDGQGYLISIDSIMIYHTSDTEYLEEFKNLKDLNIDIILLAANGKGGNLTPEEGIKLIEIIKPEVVIPMHYGVIPFTDIDPEIYRGLFKHANIQSRLKLLNIGDLYLYRKED